MKDEQIELESLGQTYFGVGSGLGGLRDQPGFEANSVYQSQQLYGTKGLVQVRIVEGRVEIILATGPPIKVRKLIEYI